MKAISSAIIVLAGAIGVHAAIAGLSSRSGTSDAVIFATAGILAGFVAFTGFIRWADETKRPS